MICLIFAREISHKMSFPFDEAASYLLKGEVKVQEKG